MPVGGRLLALQYIGYKSKRFKAGKLRVPSMDYTFDLWLNAVSWPRTQDRIKLKANSFFIRRRSK